MSGPTTDIGGVRFLLHGETDGILLSENRPTSLASDIPEASEIRTLLRVLIKRGARRVRLVQRPLFPHRRTRRLSKRDPP